MGLKKKKRPSIANVKPAKRASPAPKECCGALRGHKPDCTGSAAEDLFDGGPVNQDLMPSDVDLPEASNTPAGTTFLAALRGIEEALVRLADTVDTIKVIIGSRANEERADREAAKSAVQATPPRIRKAPKAEPQPDPAEAEPAPEVEQPKAPPPPEKKPAPAVKAAPVAVTLEQVRSEFLAFASKKGRDEAVAILGRFGAPKVGDLPVAQYPAFLSALKGA